MTPETKARVTPGPWIIKEVEPGHTFATKRRSWGLGQGQEPRIGVAAIFGDDDGNAMLIQAAVNACFALNRSDPLAAAQHLEELVKAACELTEAFGQITGVEGGSWEKFKAALSRVTGKSNP